MRGSTRPRRGSSGSFCLGALPLLLRGAILDLLTHSSVRGRKHFDRRRKFALPMWADAGGLLDTLRAARDDDRGFAQCVEDLPRAASSRSRALKLSMYRLDV